jgi:hypothetical protein
MPLNVRFIDTPEVPIVVVDVEPSVLADEVGAKRLCKLLGRTLGDLPVLLRSSCEQTVRLEGPSHLSRYALDPVIDAYPVVSIQVSFWEAA